MRTNVVRSGVLASATALAVAACGTDPADTPAGACWPPAAGGEVVTVDVQWAGGWDDVAAPAVLERWDAQVGSVQVAVLPAVMEGDAASRLTQPDPPVLARVPLEALGSLAEAGLVRTLDACLEPEGEDWLPGSAALGMLGGIRHGVTGNVALHGLLYDRAAFGRAGLSSAPATWADLVEAAAALQAAGTATPIAGLAPRLVVSGDLGSEASAGAEAFVASAVQGQLLDPATQTTDVLPLGDGRSAIHVLDPGSAWAYASALAGGQAPAADLAVAPLPGDTGPQVPVSGDVWVISTEATDAEATAATALLAWLLEPQQQALLHSLTDLFPSSLAAVDDPVLVEYWGRLPLLAELWEAARAEGRGAAAWTGVLGAGATIDEALLSAGFDGADLDTAWAESQSLLGAAAETDPLELLQCVWPGHEPSRPLRACVTA